MQIDTLPPIITIEMRLILYGLSAAAARALIPWALMHGLLIVHGARRDGQSFTVLQVQIAMLVADGEPSGTYLPFFAFMTPCSFHDLVLTSITASSHRRLHCRLNTMRGDRGRRR
jgi:hypothetical protein